MANPSRTAVSRNISGRNAALSLIFLLLISSLFFIPEIVGFQEKLSSGKDAFQKDPEPEKYETKTQESSDSISSLDRILMLLNSGFPDKIEAQKANGNTSTISLYTPSRARAVDDSWVRARDSKTKKALSVSHKDAKKIVKGIPESMARTRYSLVNYINGLDWLLKTEDPEISREQVLDYVERLDLDVTRSMIAEQADRLDFQTWSSISIGDLLTNSKALEAKQNFSAPYNPRITLAYVSIKKPLTLDWKKYRHLGFIPSRLKISGFVLGKDTDKLSLMRNGQLIRKVSLRRKTDTQGKRMFSASVKGADGVFSLRAVSKDGLVVEKFYQFLPRADKFPRDDRDDIILPFKPISSPKSFGIGELDFRLDRFFRIGARSSLLQGHDVGVGQTEKLLVF